MKNLYDPKIRDYAISAACGFAGGVAVVIAKALLGC